MPSVMTLSDVSKVYPNGKQAVTSLNLTVEPGEIFGLLGPNAAGKTTTVKMLSGILQPTSGSITFFSNDIWKMSNRESRSMKRRLGYLPENVVLFQKLTPVDFLTFISELYEIDDNVSKSRIHYYLDFFGLLDRSDEYLEYFSAGTRKKIAMIAAVIAGPDLLLLDEPFTDFDPESIYKIKLLVKEFREKGKSVIISTHFLGLASELTDRIGIIHEGELRYCGSESRLRIELDADSAKSLESLFLQLTGSKVLQNKQ